MTRVLVAVLLFCSLSAASQTVIKGKVLDRESNKPLANANVFLSFTSLGTVTQTDGTFRLEVSERGKYDFVISYVGFETVTIPLTLPADSVLNFSINMTQKISHLQNVVVGDVSTTENDQQKFKRIFLGETVNSLDCQIKNLADIHTYYADSKNSFVAYADNPIMVENRALGYTLYYDLEKFEATLSPNANIIKGKLRFEEMTPDNDAQKEIWNRARDKAYTGSLTHFMRAAYSNRLQEEGFAVAIEFKVSTKNPDPIWATVERREGKPKMRARLSDRLIDFKLKVLQNNPDSVLLYTYMKSLPYSRGLDLAPIHGQELFLYNSHQLFFHDALIVVYTKEFDQFNYRSNALNFHQFSKIIFEGEPPLVYANGDFTNQENILLVGCFGREGKVAEFLPLDYQPRKTVMTTSRKKNKPSSK